MPSSAPYEVLIEITRVHRIDVEEERDHEHPQRLVPHYLAEGAAKLAEGAAHGRSQLVACGAVMLLTVAGDQRDRDATHQTAVMMNDARVQPVVVQPNGSAGPPKINAMHTMNGTVEPM